MAKKNAIKFTMNVEVELPRKHYPMIDENNLQKYLEGQLVKIKSGLYENMFYGLIVSVNTAKNPNRSRA